jgi:hypothetical protein
MTTPERWLIEPDSRGDFVQDLHVLYILARYRTRNPASPFTLKTTTDGATRRVTVDVDEQAFRGLYAAFAEAFKW